LIRTVTYVFIATFLALVAPSWLAAEEAAANVTYVTASSVYLDVGLSDGLAVGARLQLMRGDTEIATIEIVEASSSRAVAKILTQQESPAVGDIASFATQAAPDPRVDPPLSKTAAKRRGSSGIRGRAGLRYISIDDDANANGGYSQPALDLRVDGMRMNGTPWGFDIDVRARQTYRNVPGLADESTTRAYKFLVSRGRAEDGWRFSLGRQLSPHLGAISIFDGLSADYGSEKWGAGVVSGTQPDPIDYGFSSDIQEHGFYFRFNGTPKKARQWNIVTGTVGSYQSGEINREFLYLLGRYRTRRFWAYAIQEVDFNRDWKVDEAGEDSVSPTSTFLSMNIRPTRSITLRAGYDNRRNVRLARDRVTPATDFEDAFRRGAWVGATVRMRKRFSLGVDSRTNDGGNTGSSTTHGAMVGAHGMTSRNLAVYTRVTRYTNDQIEGWFYQIDAALDVARQLRLQARAGRRDDTNLTTVPAEDTLDWYGLSLDVFLGQRWYATLEAERTQGTLDRVTQYYTTLTYRF
jgi:hypothetical protein